MIRENKISRDGFTSLLGGTDSSKAPSLLPPDQCAFAGNVVMRDGFPTTRPRFFQHGLSFPNSEVAGWFGTYGLQGAARYAIKDRDAVIVASIGGRIFKIEPLNGWVVSDITPTLQTTTTSILAATVVGSSAGVFVTDPDAVIVGTTIVIGGTRWTVTAKSGTGITVLNLDAPFLAIAAGALVITTDRNSETLPRVWMQQAEQFLVIQNGQARPIITDGVRVWRSDIAKQQVPVGTVMAYGKGRLWVAVNKNEFVAGDIVGGETHDPTYAKRDSVLYFTENTFLAEGGSFSTPVQSGEIVGMIFMPVLDTSTGNGPLLVFADGGVVFSVNASENREEWKVQRSPFQTIVQLGNSAVSQYAIAQTTNSDIFYRAKDGVRSFLIGLRLFNTQSWGNTPQSTELNRVLPFDDKKLLRYSSMIQFDNRLLFTVVPTPTAINAKHAGIGVLDFDLISSMRGKAPPAYDGVWSGIAPTLLFKGDFDGVERAFAFAINSDDKNELWEIDTKSSFDNTDTRITSFVETRALTATQPFTMKRVESVEVFVSDIKGTVDFTLLYKPDQYPCWFEWGRAQSVCAEWRTCPDDSGTCVIPVVKLPSFKTRLNFGQPPDVDGAVDDKPGRLGYEHQFRLEWVGHARVRKLVARFMEVVEETYPTVS